MKHIKKCYDLTIAISSFVRYYTGGTSSIRKIYTHLHKSKAKFLRFPAVRVTCNAICICRDLGSLSACRIIKRRTCVHLFQSLISLHAHTCTHRGEFFPLVRHRLCVTHYLQRIGSPTAILIVYLVYLRRLFFVLRAGFFYDIRAFRHAN